MGKKGASVFQSAARERKIRLLPRYLDACSMLERYLAANDNLPPSYNDIRSTLRTDPEYERGALAFLWLNNNYSLPLDWFIIEIRTKQQKEAEEAAALAAEREAPPELDREDSKPAVPPLDADQSREDEILDSLYQEWVRTGRSNSDLADRWVNYRSKLKGLVTGSDSEIIYRTFRTDLMLEDALQDERLCQCGRAALTLILDLKTPATAHQHIEHE